MKTTYELIVVGGGFAGVAAAITAAREGVDVLLIERYNCLGGAAGNGLVMPFMPFYSKDPTTGAQRALCGNLFLEILERMQAFCARPASRPVCEFDEEVLKLILNRMCRESGVSLLFNTAVVAAEAAKGTLHRIRAYSKGVTMELTADAFVDATGDAELSALAGCVCKLGRERDSLCQPMTLCFRMSGVDKAEYHKIHREINPLYQQRKAEGKLQNPREDVLIFENFHNGVLHFNSTRIVKRNPVDPFDVTAAEIEAREQAFELLHFLQESFPAFAHARILSTALQIGTRESRKVVGEYILTVEDLKSLARFEDGIAVANYDIDIHNPEGAGTSHYYFKAGEWYQIPYRCLIPKGMNNLLVAGRCISSTHEAQASYRIMPFCCELGEAAGVAVSVAKQTGTAPRHVSIDLVQKSLRQHGFVL